MQFWPWKFILSLFESTSKYLYRVCIVFVSCLYRVVSCLYRVCIVFVSCLYRVVSCLYRVCIVFVSCLFRVCIVFVSCLYRVCIVFVSCLSPFCWWDLHVERLMPVSYQITLGREFRLASLAVYSYGYPKVVDSTTVWVRYSLYYSNL